MFSNSFQALLKHTFPLSAMCPSQIYLAKKEKKNIKEIKAIEITHSILLSHWNHIQYKQRLQLSNFSEKSLWLSTEQLPAAMVWPLEP